MAVTPEELTERLSAGADHEAWVAALADYFSVGGAYFGHGTDNAGDEAYWLIRHVEDWRDDAWDAAPQPGLITRIVDVARRRVEERRPLAYLLGEAWFAGLRFEVDDTVLVPRSPLAEIIERRFEPWVELHPGDRVLDVGTGSGCLAIATAFRCPEILVDATDVSDSALEVAARNVARHGVADRVRLYQADLFPAHGLRYGVIVANPPYVPDEVLAALPAEYAHEPALALAGGPDGLGPTERLLRAAAERLTPDGVLIVEVGAEAETLSRAHPELPVVWLEFERGGEGVFLIGAHELAEYFARGARGTRRRDGTTDGA